jgi:hypothetical protein
MVVTQSVNALRSFLNQSATPIRYGRWWGLSYALLVIADWHNFAIAFPLLTR